VTAVLASALADPGFPRALLACVAVGAFAPTIGAFLVQKRLSLIGDGVGHVAFAGVGLGLLVDVWPVWTALAFAVTGAVALELLRAFYDWMGFSPGDLPAEFDQEARVLRLG